MATDDSGIEKVELWVDGINTNISDDNEPYSLAWNTTNYEDGSSHIIVIRAYDSNGNITDSSPIGLVVDNSSAIPTSVNLFVSYEDDSIILIWSRNYDDDFKSYLVYESDTDDYTLSVLIHEEENQNDTTYTVNDMVEDGELRYYWIAVRDTLGLENISNIAIANTTIFPVPTEFPLEGNTGWVYERLYYNNEYNYTSDIPDTSYLDTLYIFDTPEDYYLYSWSPEEYYSLVKNYDNKLLNIGHIQNEYSPDSIIFYEKSAVWAVYDEVFDTSLISQDYDLRGMSNRYVVEDSLFNQLFNTYLFESIIGVDLTIESYVSLEGFNKFTINSIYYGFFNRVKMLQKLEDIIFTNLSNGENKSQESNNSNYLDTYLPIPIFLGKNIK